MAHKSGTSADGGLSLLSVMVTRRFSTIQAYVTSIVVLGAGAFLVAIRLAKLFPIDHPPLAGVLLFIVIEIALELATRSLATGAAAASIAFVAFMGVALVFGPAWGAVVAVAGVTITQAWRRKPAVRIAFNAAQYTIAVVAGTVVYLALGGQIPPSSLFDSALPFAAFVVTFLMMNSAAVSGAVALSERKEFLEVWGRNTLHMVGYDLVVSVLGLVIAWVYQFGVWPTVGLVVPILLLRHAYSVNLQLQATGRELLDLMVKAIEARDPYTSGHSQRVAEIARALAKALRLSLKDLESTETAALLHDVGKIYEEFAPILRKAGKLSPEERALMQTHATRGAELVGTISSLHGSVYKCVRHHHENWDGSGYPDALTGDQIPMGARIILVADTIDAMTTDRPYRSALPFERVAEELRKYSGKQFDPQVVEAFHRSPMIRRLIENTVSRAAVSVPARQEKVAQLAGR